MRLSGLASGFDTDEMVKQLMAVERMKVDRVEQRRQVVQWQQEAYNDINKQFANFILNTQRELGLRQSSGIGKNLNYVKKATSTNEMVATANATNKNVNGSYTFEVKQLATNASFVSSRIEEELVVDSEGGNLSFELNGKTIEVENNDGITMDDLAKAINDSDAGVTAFYDKSNKRLFMQTETTGSEAKIELSGDNSVLEILGYSDAIDGNDVDGDNSVDNDKAVLINGKDSEIVYNGVKLTNESNDIELNGLNINLKAEGVTTINVATNTDEIIEKIEKFVEDYNNLIDEVSGLINEKKYPSYHPLSQEERAALSETDVKLWDEKAKSGLLNRDEHLQRILQNTRLDLYRQLDNLEGSFSHITQIGISTEKYARGTAGGKLQIDTDKLRAAIEEDAEGVMDLLFHDPKSEKFGETKPTKPKQDDYEDDDEFQTAMDEYKGALGEYNKGLKAHEAEQRKNRKENAGILTSVYDNLIDGMKSIIDKSGPGQDSDLYRSIKSNMLIDFVTSKGSISDLDKSVNEMNKEIDNLNILLAKREEAHYAKFTAMEKYMQEMNGQSMWLQQQLMQF